MPPDTGPPSTPASSSGSSAAKSPDTIVLQILSPSPEIPGGRLVFSSIPPDTSIGLLKSRIQQSLDAGPHPERQRIIYRGRPLLDANLKLRDVFQSELNAPERPNIYTLHLVLPPVQSGTVHTTSTSAIPDTRSVGDQRTTTPSTAPTDPANSRPHHHHQHHHNNLAQAQNAQMMLQNQLNMLQQQLAVMSQIQPHLQAPNHAQPPQSNSSSQVSPIPLTSFPAPPNLAHFQAMIAQQQQMRAQTGLPETHNPLQHAQVHTHHLQHSQAVPTIPSPFLIANGGPLPHVPMTTIVHETIGPSGQRTRVVVNEFPMPQQDRSDTSSTATSLDGIGRLPSLASQSFFANPSTMNRTLSDSQAGQQNAPNVTSEVDPVASQLPLAPTSNVSSIPLPLPTSSTTTTAWILNTPNGPAGFVFAAEHGLFASTSQQTISTRFTPSTLAPRRLRYHQAADSRVRPPNAPAQSNTAGAAAVANNSNAPAGNAGPAQPAAQRPGQANDDVVAFVIQRGWLFMRLYIFLFFLAEPGSWRYWLFLSLAAIICLMPRNNPIRDFSNMVRSHVDNLVTPRDRPGRGDNPPRQQGRILPGADALRPQRDATQPTPQEAAARLAHEHGQQNMNVVWDTFHRVERALALFVASLIPGVGERHIRVREEARREAERVENERVATEATAVLESQANTDKAHEHNIATEAEPADSFRSSNDVDQGVSKTEGHDGQHSEFVKSSSMPEE